MSLKETSPKPMSFKKEAARQDGKDPFTAEMERKAAYVETQMSEYFQTHGIPDPAEFIAVIRTLSVVFSSDYSEENSHYRKSSKNLRSAK